MDLTDLKARNTRILALLKDGQRPMPSPSAVALQLMRSVERRDVGVFEVCRIARADPVLVAKTVQMANSALYAGLRQTAAMEDAVMRIGVAALARLAVGLSLVHAAAGWGGDFDLDRFWRDALARGLVLQHLARRLRNLPSSEAFSLGLLCEIGELAMVAAYGAAATQGACGAALDLLAQQRQRFGFDQAQASAALLEGWSFPMSLWLATLPLAQGGGQTAGRGAELAVMVEIARDLAASLDPARDLTDLPRLCLGAARLGLDADAVVEMLDQIRGDLPDLAGVLEVRLAPAQAEVEFQRLRAALLASPPSADGAPGTVLVVAAPVPANESLRRALHGAELHVQGASSATQGMDQLRQLRPDVLVLDADLPGLDAFALCRQLREERGAGLYILLLSADPAGDAALRAVEAGANDVLGKPVEHKILIAKVKLGGRTVRLIAALQSERHHVLGMQRELTAVNADLREAAYTDELTGLPNRRALDEFLNTSWIDAVRSGRRISCVVLDMDHFKLVNDTRGHEVGDRVLCAVTKVLQAQTRGTDLLARWGGEELVLVCPGADAAGAALLAERMRAAVERLRGDFPSVTLSAGVAQAGTQGAAEMLRAADAALLRAKREGRNRVVIAGTGER
jgi:diguanylate cyclase (GGDEF)-like protein